MVGWVTAGKVSGGDEREVLALIFGKMDNLDVSLFATP